MTEAEWLGCDDPRQMIEQMRGLASRRKTGLLAVACCRRLWSHLTDQRSRDAVVIKERLIDGAATEKDRLQAFEGARAAWMRVLPTDIDPDDDRVLEARRAYPSGWVAELLVSVPDFHWVSQGENWISVIIDEVIGDFDPRAGP